MVISVPFTKALTQSLKLYTHSVLEKFYIPLLNPTALFSDTSFLLY